MYSTSIPHSGNRRNPTTARFAAGIAVSLCLAAAPLALAATVTFNSIDGEDGWLLESTESSNVGGTKNAGGTGAQDLRAGDAAGDKQYKALVSFDTASLPDGATIVSAQLRLRRGTTVGTNPFTTHGTCRVDIKGGSGFGGSTALANGDFEAAAGATQVATMSNAVANGDWSEGTLNATGRSFINKTGKTQLRVYFATGDNDDDAADNIGWYGGGDIAANRPELVVTYSTGDTTPPTVSVTAPAAGATVLGSAVTVSASASDNVDVVGVQFKLDGINLETEDQTDPYSVTWDSTTAAEGSHTLTAVARDAAGNSTTSSGIGVTVSNTTPIVYDANNLSVAAQSSGDSTAAVANAGAAGGFYLRVTNNAAGDFITLNVDVPATATYSVTVRYDEWNNRGISQLAIDGADLGGPHDGYRAVF